MYKSLAGVWEPVCADYGISFLSRKNLHPGQLLYLMVSSVHLCSTKLPFVTNRFSSVLWMTVIGLTTNGKMQTVVGKGSEPALVYVKWSFSSQESVLFLELKR